MHWLALLAVILTAAFAVSTPEQRRAARDQMKWANWLWPVPVLLWVLILEPWRWLT